MSDKGKQLSYEPDWNKWSLMGEVPLPLAVALSCNVNPENVHLQQSSFDGFIAVGRTPSDRIKEFRRRMEIAESHKHNALHVKNDGSVDLIEFGVWCEDIGLDIPSEFPRRKEQAEISYKWPWGNYDTKLLKSMAAAVVKFWKPWDSDNPEDAPRNQDVIDWLKKQGVSDRVARIMASIIRADHLPTGPRATKPKRDQK